jgi:hypothetical protein
MGYSDEIDELLISAYDAPRGPVRLAFLEQAMNIADQHNDLHQGYTTRQDIIQCAVFTGAPEKALPAFSWCLAQSDKHPDKFVASTGGFSEDLMWQFKWMVENLPFFPQVTRAQIEATFDDMERRYTDHGISLRPAWMHRGMAAAKMGDGPERIRELRTKWQDLRRDAYADCRACESHKEMEIHLALDEPDRALAISAPLCDGRSGCAEVPASTLGELLMVLHERGETERADELHQRGYRLCHTNPEFTSTMGRHLHYATLRGNLEEATRIFERHLIWALEMRTPDWVFTFYLGVLSYLTRMCVDSAELRVRLPIEFELHRDDGVYDARQILGWFETKSRDIAKQFDARNGNERYTRLVDTALATA